MSISRSAIAAMLGAVFAAAGITPGRTATHLTPLVALAHAHNVPVRKASGAIEVKVDGSWLRITPGDVTVHEDGVPMMRLSATPVVHRGQLCIASQDASALLDLEARADAAFEVKQLATPTPRPTIAPVHIANDPGTPSVPEGKHLVGNVGFELDRQASAKYYQFNADGGTKNVHGALYANGSPDSRPLLSGIVTIGAGTQHATIGTVADPLYGNLFSAGGAVGASYENAHGTVFSWANSAGFGDRHSVSISRSSGRVTSVFAAVSDADGTQMLFGRQYTAITQSGEFDRELWIGSRGAGAALHYRSDGRLYTEARMGIASPALPLIAGDAPNEADIGYQFSSNLGMRGGIADARGYGSRPFAQLYGRAGALQLGLARMAGESTVSVGVDARAMRANFDYGRFAQSSFVNFTGALPLRRGLLETNAYLTPGQGGDAWVDYRLRSLVPSVTVGLESIGSGSTSRIGPTIGYSAPFPGSMVAAVELHPLEHGQGLRFSVQHQILAADSHARAHFVAVSLDTQPSQQIYALIDGVREQQLTSASGKISVPDGTHYVSLQSADGKLGSPETRVVDGTPQSISMPLWPVMEIAGSVRLPERVMPSLLGAHPRLSGIVLVVQPQNITTQTDDNGNFDLPAQAIAPHSQIAVDVTTLPDGLAADAAQTIPESGSIVVTLKASKKVQKVVF